MHQPIVIVVSTSRTLDPTMKVRRDSFRYTKYKRSYLGVRNTSTKREVLGRNGDYFWVPPC
jgi:hypothetical protein